MSQVWRNFTIAEDPGRVNARPMIAQSARVHLGQPVFEDRFFRGHLRERVADGARAGVSHHLAKRYHAIHIAG